MINEPVPPVEGTAAAAVSAVQIWQAETLADLRSMPPPVGPTLVLVKRHGPLLDYDLRLLMSWGDGSGVPTSDKYKYLYIVGVDNNGLLHIRIFDAGGNFTDKDETTLPTTQAGAISTLKLQLPGLQSHVLTSAEKAQVIGKVTSILGQPPPPTAMSAAGSSGGSQTSAPMPTSSPSSRKETTTGGSSNPVRRT